MRSRGTSREAPHFAQFSYNASPLESTLLGLPVSVENKRLTGTLTPFRMNTYKKQGVAGVLWLTRHWLYFPIAPNSFTIRYIAANPASRTPLSSETEI